MGLLGAGMAIGIAAFQVPGARAADDNGNLVLQLLDRVNTLEEQTRDMRGQIDQLTNQVQQQNATLSKQIADMNFAMQNGHGGASAASGAGTASGGSSAPLASADDAPAKRTAADILKDGNAALLQRDYATAQADAQQVLSGPKSPRQIDAQYLLAQSLAGQKQYRQSALAYYDTYNRSPHGARAPSALLGVAATLVALGDKASACQALDKLASEFPEPEARIRSAEGIYRKKAKCS
ncbi:tol-pal system YbgF family protein [Novacetimonas cocois]